MDLIRQAFILIHEYGTDTNTSTAVRAYQISHILLTLKKCRVPCIPCIRGYFQEQTQTPFPVTIVK